MKNTLSFPVCRAMDVEVGDVIEQGGQWRQVLATITSTTDFMGFDEDPTAVAIANGIDDWYVLLITNKLPNRLGIAPNGAVSDQGHRYNPNDNPEPHYEVLYIDTPVTVQIITPVPEQENDNV